MNPAFSTFEQVTLVSALLVMVLGALAAPIRRHALSLPLIAMLTGAILGPVMHVSQLTDQVRFTLLFDLASLSLATGLFGTALQLPRWDIIHRWRDLLVLIAVALPLMWLTGGLITYFALGLPLTTSLLIGASLAPTDPILARTVALGPLAHDNVPNRVRRVLLGESSINDGAALPLVALMAVLLPGATVSLTHWFTHVVLWSVCMSVLLGLAIGWVGAYAERITLTLNRKTPPTFRVGFPLSLAVLSLMALRALGVDGVLGVFFSGLAFNAFRRKQDRRDEAELQEIVDDLFSVLIFFVFGLALPWAAWAHLGWTLVPLVGGILLLRRLPWMLALGSLVPQIKALPESAFVGWFGPMGVSALFYATLLINQSVSTSVWPPIAAVVAASVIVFGVTGVPLTRRLGRWERTHERREARPQAEHDERAA